MRPPTIGRYRVLRELGRGGMAEVLLGVLEGTRGVRRPVVLKRILPRHRGQPEFEAMFVDEARVLSSLHHPNIVSVIELGEHEGALFIAMEYLDGWPLQALVERGTPWLAPTLVAHLGAEACAALAAAHDHRGDDGQPQPIVHRDISPDNLFVTRDGALKLIDFGIAKSTLQEHATSVGVVKGKLLYMAPEQLSDRARVDHRADLFALGATLLRVATGRFVYPTDAEVATIAAISAGEVELEGLEALPSPLAAILRRALAPDPDARFGSAAEMRRALLGWLRETAPTEDARAGLAAALRGLPPTAMAEQATQALSLVEDLEGIDAPTEAIVRTDARTRRLDPDEALPPVPAAVASTVQLPDAFDGAPAPPPTLPAPAHRQPRAFLFAGLGAAAVLAALAVLLWPAEAPPPEVLEREPRATLATPAPAPVPAPATTVTWEFRTSPGGAEVRLGADTLGYTPLRLERPAETGIAQVSLERAGHAPLTVEVDRGRDLLVDRTLAPNTPPAEVEPVATMRPVRRGSARGMRGMRASPAMDPMRGFFRVD